MSFDKKTWLPDYDLTEKEMNDLEDRTEKAVSDLEKKVDNQFKVIKITMPSATGWENGKSYDVPSNMVPFLVVQGVCTNQNGSLIEMGSSIRPNNQQNKLYAELSSSQGWAVNRKAQVLIMKV